MKAKTIIIIWISAVNINAMCVGLSLAIENYLAALGWLGAMLAGIFVIILVKKVPPDELFGNE